MKKFEFQLEKLLSYKGQMLDSELMTLAVLNNQLSEAQHRLLTLKTELEKCGLEYESRILGSTTPATCRMYLQYAEHLKEQIQLMMRTVESITAQIDKQVEIIKKLKLETKSLETMKTSKHDEYQREDRKAAEQQLEEFVSTAQMMKKIV